ncbi:MAG: hypothetical protein WCP21_16740, partial [Armatimonadota bacterium]
MSGALNLLEGRALAAVLLGILTVWAATGPTPAHAAPASGSITTTPTAVVLQSQSCRWEIGLNGQNLAFVALADKTDYCDPGQPFMQAQLAG